MSGTADDEERARLRAVGDWYLSGELEIDRMLIRFRFSTLLPYLRGKSCLELGSAEGVMTRLLAPNFDSLTVVEGAPQLAAAIPALPNTDVVCCLFEDFSPSQTFDSIVLEHVLEHVNDPVDLLLKAQEWLSPGGRMLIGVPNAESLHRLAAVKMGLLASPTTLNARDLAVGHRRVYSLSTLRADLDQAGLKIEQYEGVFLKPVSNAQIEDSWSEEMIVAFYELGKDFPTLCAEIMVVASVD